MREVPLVMPTMTMTMTEGTFLLWHRREGETIRAGDIICEVASDKVDMEVESPIEGTLSRLVATPDEVIAVGAPLAFINSEAEDLLAGTFDDAPAPAAEPVPEPAQVAAPAAAASPPSRRGPRPAVPFARRRASELHIDIEAVSSSGSGGLITVSDVENAAAGTKHAATNGVAAAAPAPVQTDAPATQPVQAESDAYSAFGDIPSSVVILGGGAIGCEFATIWNSFGAKVTIVEALPNLVPLEDVASSKALEKAFKRHGIGFKVGVKVTSATATADGAEVTLEDGSTLSATWPATVKPASSARPAS